MFGSLKKLFGGTASHSPLPASKTVSPRLDALLPGFLQREPVFERNGQIGGHLFHVRSPMPPDMDGTAGQRILDQMLLEALSGNVAARQAPPAFISLNSASLDLPALAEFKTANLVVLVQLAEDAEAASLHDSIEQLRRSGMQFGLYRQPKHPAFARLISLVDFAAIDIGVNQADAARDFSAAIRASRQNKPVRLLACNVETVDDYRFCFQWHYDQFIGQFAASLPSGRLDSASDPHKAQLFNLMRLVQGEADTAEIVEALKQDPLLSFRILRYLNSPALGLGHRIDSLVQALIILGRQRLTRWLAVLLFSVRDPELNDWLLVESALTRGRLMELLAEHAMPAQPHDPLFLTGIFSCLDRLLRQPMAQAISDIPLANDIRRALLDASGPYAPLLALAKASEAVDQSPMADLARAAGVTPDSVNRALLTATAWASGVMEYWD